MIRAAMRAAGSSSGRRRVSHYEILAELGRGGMGVVYRARDLDLGREVALKCSLQEKAASAGARRRFLREARAAAALTHANIVPVFEVFEAEGQLWLAMELVAGRSLRELLDSQGALPLPEFLGCAEGLAGALAEAQRHRILHRDITPRNILIGADGRPRLTDFGLARHFIPQGEESMAPTTAGGPVTRRGAIVGTPGYMAPEQVLGRPLDTRCDIFSLGAVLYEMCTGRPAFPQRESGRLIDAILHEEPVPMSRPGNRVPAELEQIIRKCLRKPPDERYQHAADLLADLKTLRRHTGSGERPSPAPARTRGRPAAAVMSIGGTLLAAALFYGLHWLQSAGPPVEPGGGPILESLVTWPGEDHGSRISPDGQWVSFLSSTDGQQSVWVVRVSGGDPRPLLAEQGRITSHAWSPDGERMALTVLLDGALYLRILPAFGGARELNESLDPQFAELSLVRWHGPRLYLASAARGLWRYDTLDGSLKLLLGPSDERGSRHQFDICEDERQVVYTRQRASRPDLWLADLSTGETRPLTSRQPGPDDFESKARWLGSGCRELVFGSNRSGQLDLWQLSLPGEERRQITFSAGSKHVEDASRDGSLISMREDLRSAHLWMMEVRPDAPGPRQLTADSRDDFWPSASADGTIVFHRTPPRIDNASGMLDAQIFRGRLQAGRIVDAKLVVPAGTGARISPDGRWLAFTREADAKGYEVWIEDRASERSWRIAGMYRPPRLYPHPIDQVETNLAWSADSGSLFFVVRGPEGGDRLKRFRPDSGKGSVEDLVASKPGEILHDPLPAADARIVCYVLSTTGSSLASRVICHDLTSGARSPPWSPPGPPGADLLLRGWVRPQGEALVLQCDVMGDWTERIELWALRTDASARRIGRIDRAFGGTSRWEEGSSTLYLTKAEEHASAHNLYAYRPEDGSLTRLTNFDTPGISIDGLEILGGGRLVFALAERNENIWLIRLRRQGG